MKDQENKIILLVEDDKKISMALGMRLNSMGYEVACAADAVYAMNEAVRCKPSVILIDINLPGGDGFIVASRIRSSLQIATTPIIFITASKEPSHRVRASEFGAAAFIEKPFSAGQLTQALEECM